MKTLIAIILALGIGFAAAYVVVSKQKSAPAPQAESAPTPVPASETSAATPKVIVKTVAGAPAGETPQDMLTDLLNIHLGTTAGERNTALRTVVFKLESLAQCGNDAVPAIRAFIGRSVDVNYEETPNNNQGNGGGGGNGNGNGGGGGNQFGNGGGNGNGGGGNGGFRGARRARNLQNLQTDWVVPPSLRLGLVGTLKEIGGADAEQALADMLSSTARGVEVAYLAVVLEDIAPGKYRDEAVKAAKDLLTNPVTVDSPDQLDDLSKSYLYGVLEFYKDTSFAATAQQMLVGKDGRLDQDAMDYLSTVLGGQSVAALSAAYNNSSLTNQFDKTRLGRDILGFVGQNSQADQFFTSMVSDPNVDSRQKIFSIIQLAGGFGGNLTDQQLIAARITLLNSLLQQNQVAGDPTLSRAITATINGLQTGNTPNFGDIFGNNNPGGGGGGRRNRGGGNGGNNGGG